jgi:peptidoglycan/LPS O-acetylase OafA/YrhL
MASELPPPAVGTLVRQGAPAPAAGLAEGPVGAADATGDGWRHVPALDGLRGIAVLGVLLFHADHLTGGFLGVDLFFTLSGFLITSLLLDEGRRTGTVDLIAFWGRRFRRLLPAILVLLAIVVVVTWWIGSPAQLDAVHAAGPAALVYLANWHQIAQDSGYWASFSEASPLTHLWSLGIEEQFYVVWPLVFAVLWRLGRHSERLIAAVAGLAALASAVLMAVLYTGGDPTRVYMGTDTRAFSILVGVAAATAPVRRSIARLIGRARVAVGAVMLLIIAFGGWTWATVDGASSSALFEGGLAVHGALGALLIVACAQDDRLLAARLFSGRTLSYLGSRSYGLYLWHWPVYVALDADRAGLDGWALTALRVTVAMTMAELSYRLVETPIRRRATWAHGWTGATAMVASIVAVALVYLAVPQASAEVARFDPGTLAPATTLIRATTAPSTTSPATTTEDSAAAAPAQETATTEATATTATTSPPPPTTIAVVKPLVRSVLWMGDSVAWDAAPGVEAALTAAGLEVETAAYVGTGVVPSGDVDPIELFLGSLRNTRRDLAIFQLSGWDLEHPEAEQRHAVRAFRDETRASGATMVFLLPPTVDPERYDPDFSIILDEVLLMASEDPGGTVLLDSASMWGDYGRDLNGDGIPERKPDGVHVCPSGAALLGQWLALELAARYDGVIPADPVLWAGLPWVTDARYNTPLGVCS